jgi:hypothetical protein
MGLDSPDYQVLSFEVVGFACGFAEGVSIAKEDLVRVNQVSDEVFGWERCHGLLPDLRSLCERGQSAGRENIQSTKAFGDFIDCGEQLFILPLERNMKLEEIGTLDVPMRQMGLPHECVRIGEKGFQA